jgi:hypothetical protein
MGVFQTTWFVSLQDKGGLAAAACPFLSGLRNSGQLSPAGLDRMETAEKRGTLVNTVLAARHPVRKLQRRRLWFGSWRCFIG